MTLPDGTMHITFCDVGQGDAVYVRFPDGRDLLIDGGPDARVLQCLGRGMPFWDRTIDLVAATHGQRDHVGGLTTVLDRFGVGSVIISGLRTGDEAEKALLEALNSRSISVRTADAGDRITVGATTVSVLWPRGTGVTEADGSVRATSGDPNADSLVLLISYGAVQILLTGDAGLDTVNRYGDLVSQSLADGHLEVLKVPHHGSRTGVSGDSLDALSPNVSVISVGKNSYGHPAEEVLTMLADRHIRVLRTDQLGDIRVTTDGTKWSVR